MSTGTIAVCMWVQEKGSIEENIEVAVAVSAVFFHEASRTYLYVMCSRPVRKIALDED